MKEENEIHNLKIEVKTMTITEAETQSKLEIYHLNMLLNKFIKNNNTSIHQNHNI